MRTRISHLHSYISAQPIFHLSLSYTVDSTTSLVIAHSRVHICTQSCTSQYTCVPSRIRLGTYMYSAVYEWVHICTLSYTTGYIYVPCRIRLGTYMYSVYTSRYMYVPTRSTFGEEDPFCHTRWSLTLAAPMGESKRLYIFLFAITFF